MFEKRVGEIGTGIQINMSIQLASSRELVDLMAQLLEGNEGSLNKFCAAVIIIDPDAYKVAQWAQDSWRYGCYGDLVETCYLVNEDGTTTRSFLVNGTVRSSYSFRTEDTGVQTTTKAAP